MWWLALAGCVSDYVPMAGLQGPVAIDRRFANFADTRVGITCVPNDRLDAEEARTLCRRLQVMFENQGATVVYARNPLDPVENEPAAGELAVHIIGRVVHEETTNWLFWERVTDYTVAQDITVRDETGFLLAQHTVTARFWRRLGFTSDAVGRYSEDFYGQLSQLAFDAKLRRQILREGDSP